MLELVAFIMHDDGPTHLRAPKNQDRWAFRYDLKEDEQNTPKRTRDRFSVNTKYES